MDVDYRYARLIASSYKLTIAGHYKSMIVAEDIPYSCSYHSTQLVISSHEISTSTNLPSMRIYDEEESQGEKNASIPHPRRDQFTNFLGKLLIPNDSMTMITNWEKSIYGLRTSKEKAKTWRSSTPIPLLPMNNGRVDSHSVQDALAKALQQYHVGWKVVSSKLGAKNPVKVASKVGKFVDPGGKGLVNLQTPIKRGRQICRPLWEGVSKFANHSRLTVCFLGTSDKKPQGSANLLTPDELPTLDEWYIILLLDNMKIGFL